MGDVERVYRDRGHRMWQAVFAFTGDREVAADAIAEAFAQALRAEATIRDIEAWVWRAAFRIAAGELKERRRSGTGLPANEWYEMEDPARELVAALAHLPEKQRGSVILHDALGYPSRDVAAMIGSTAAAVRVHLVRGRRRLRHLLEEDADE